MRLSGRPEIYELETDFEMVQACLQEAMAIRTKLFGSDHWQTVDCKFALERIERLVQLDPLQRRKYAEAKETLRVSQDRSGADAALQATESLKEVLGESHPEYANVLAKDLGNLYAQIFNLGGPQQRQRHQQTLAIRASSPGQMHPDYADSLESLVFVIRSTISSTGKEDPERASVIPMLRQALKIRESTQGKRHPDTARS